MVHFPSKNNPTVCTLFSISANSPVKRKLESNSSEAQSQHLSSNSITCVHESDEKGRESFFKESSKELTFILEFFAKVEIYSITLEISLETCQIKRIFWG